MHMYIHVHMYSYNLAHGNGEAFVVGGVALDTLRSTLRSQIPFAPRYPSLPDTLRS